MARRAPFEFRIGREADGHSRFRADLRLLMLDDFHRDVFLMEFLIGLQHLHGVFGGTEGVHQSQWQIDAKSGPRGQHLSDDDVDETHLPCLVATYRQQRLGAIESHRSAKTAVKLQERRFGERVNGLVVIDGLIHVMEAGNADERFDLVLTNPTAGLLIAPDLVQTTELGDGHVGHSVLPHLRGRVFEYVLSQCLSLSNGRCYSMRLCHNTTFRQNRGHLDTEPT